jgi:hypothetical protein
LCRLHQILPLKPWERSCTSTSARKSSALPKQGLCRSIVLGKTQYRM